MNKEEGDTIKVERKMAAGEFESYKAFEETTVRNMKLVVSFSEETRKMMRDALKKIKNLENIVLSRDQQIAQMQQQIGL